MFDGAEAKKLLERFAELYGEVPLRGSMVELGTKLWRDYWIYRRRHMIRTEEGWEAGDGLEHYFASLEPWESIGDIVCDEVGWRYGKMKFPMIIHLTKSAKDNGSAVTMWRNVSVNRSER